MLMTGKRVLSIILVVAMCFTAFGSMPMIASAASYTGAGTESNPYIIADANQLKELAEEVNGGTPYTGVFFELGQNIDLSDFGAGYRDGKGWLPIGNAINKTFQGTLDGKGNSITGLFIDDSELNFAGLFGVLDGEVKNLQLIDVNIKAFEHVGGVAGYLGYNSEAKLDGCSVSGSIVADETAGGIAGRVEDSLINNCYTSCSVTARGNYVGGIAGILTVYVGQSSVIQHSYSLGQIQGDGYLGGIVGLASGTGILVTGCYATGVVTATASDLVGGIAGSVAYGASITKCAALNKSVEANIRNGHANALVGGLTDPGTIDENIVLETMGSGQYGFTTDYGSSGDEELNNQQIADGALDAFFPEGNGWVHDAGMLPGIGEPVAPPPLFSPADVSIVPADGSTKAKRSGSIVVTFDKKMKTDGAGTVSVNGNAITGDWD